MDYRDNLEIDIIDLCKSIIKYWKVMIICAVLGAILLGALGYIKSAKTINTDTGEVYSGATVSEYESLRNNLAAGDIALIETAANQYLGYVKEYMELKEYGKKSILLNSNSQNVSKITKYYAINEKSVTVDDIIENETTLGIEGSTVFVVSDISNISNAYNVGIRDEETIKKIKDAIGYDVEDGMINELISVGINGRSTLYVKCLGKDKEMCEQIIDILEQRIDELTPSIQENYDFELVSMMDFYNRGKESEVDTAQRDYNSYLHSLIANMNTISAVIPAEQKGYYNYLIEKINSEFLSDEYMNSDGDRINISDIDSITDIIPKEDVVQNVNTKVVRTIDKKYIIIGFVLGVFAVIFLAAVFYMLSGKLHTSEDLRDAFGVSVFGEIKDKTEADRFDVITSGITIASSKMDVKKIALIGAARDESADALRSAISTAVSGKPEIEVCEICNDVLNSPADMESLAGVDAAVMVEKKNSSKYENIARELELCNKYGVKVLGAVMMK